MLRNLWLQKNVLQKIIFHPSLNSTCLWIRDPGSGMGKNQDPGSGINITDPQHWLMVISNFSEIWFDINFCFLSARAERRPQPGWPRSPCCSRRRRCRRHRDPWPPLASPGPPSPPPPDSSSSSSSAARLCEESRRSHRHTRNAKCFLYLQYIFIRLSNTVRYMDF